MATTYKYVKTCARYHSVALDFSAYSVNWYVDEINPFPSPRVNGLVSAQRGYSTIFYFTQNPGGFAVYTVEFTVRDGQGGPVIGVFNIVFDVTNVCIESTETCCDNAVNIRWLGVVGGIKEWPFPGVREFEVRVGDALSFKNSALQIQYSQRKDIYAGKSINSKYVTKEQYDFLTELKVAIQAWEWNPITSTWDAILFDNESFATYKSNTRIREFSARYIVAAESIIQTQ